MISHIDNINRNLARALKGVPVGMVQRATGMSHAVLVQACRSNVSTRLETIDSIAMVLGTTVAQLMVMEGIETNWYQEASAEFLAANLTQIRVERGLTKSDLARLIDEVHWHAKAASVSRYENGRIPTLGSLQEIADALGMEVADLLLPPEGEV